MEHLGLGNIFSEPISRAGGRVELDKPILGGLFGYTSAEAAMQKQPNGWTTDLRISAGLGVRF